MDAAGAAGLGGGTDISLRFIASVPWPCSEQCIHQTAPAAEISVAPIDFFSRANIIQIDAALVLI